MTDREAIEYFEAIFETEALGKTDIEAMNVAISALKEREERAMNWISVKERLPEEETDVLLCFEDGTMIVGFYLVLFDETIWNAIKDIEWYSECEATPTHWMPLPELPKEET